MIMCLFIISLVSSRVVIEMVMMMMMNALCNLILLCVKLTNLMFCVVEGNGKVKTKEPLEMANMAIVQLKEALDMASQSD